jgi:PilZ domain-containing protein
LRRPFPSASSIASFVFCNGIEALNMVETRVAPRFRVRKPATVEHWGLKFGCTVCDISITGAALEFSDLIRTLSIPDKFNLIITEDALKLPCRVVWRREYRMGVAFD